MRDLRDTLKRFLGVDWERRTEPFRKAISAAMIATGNTSPLSAVIPLAKDMESHRKDPTLLMAVAVDMADPPKSL